MHIWMIHQVTSQLNSLTNCPKVHYLSKPHINISHNIFRNHVQLINLENCYRSQNFFCDGYDCFCRFLVHVESYSPNIRLGLNASWNLCQVAIPQSLLLTELLLEALKWDSKLQWDQYSYKEPLTKKWDQCQKFWWTCSKILVNMRSMF